VSRVFRTFDRAERLPVLTQAVMAPLIWSAVRNRRSRAECARGGREAAGRCFWRHVGTSLLLTGDISEGRAHLDRTVAVYDPAEHRQLATRFGQDVRVSALCYRALGLWMLGFPEAALADTKRALKDAREIGQAATSMFMLSLTSFTHIFYGDYAAANALAEELISSADEKGALYWKAQGMSHQGCVLTLTGEAAAAVQMISFGTAAWRSTGATLWTPLWLSYLAKAYADLEKFDDAWRCVGEAKTAVATTKERWYEAELYRMAGEIALKPKMLDAKKAQANFDRALTIARVQQAKSWELRAAMSLARLWRDQDRPTDAHDLLAPIYARFTEGFDSLDLRDAKALLD
jgi:predicted ATPase